MNQPLGRHFSKSRNPGTFSGLGDTWTRLSQGDDFKGFGFLFLSPFEGLIFSSLRLCRRYLTRFEECNRVKIDSQTCKGCGLCVQRCPMEVLQMEEDGQEKKSALIVPERCLGCGLCVHKYPTRSLILELRPEINYPPQTVGEWAKRWAADHKRGPID